MRDHERRRYEQFKADRDLIDQAAAHLRKGARSHQYAGLLHHPETVFGLAAILDELARHLRDLDEGVRWQTISSCRQLLGLPPT